MKKNCWEFKKCGRESGGTKVNELGVCIAATEIRTDGMNSGKNGGRACWALAGTLCEGKIQGVFALKFNNCFDCDFYIHVWKEEGKNHQLSKDILEKLK